MHYPSTVACCQAWEWFATRCRWGPMTARGEAGADQGTRICNALRCTRAGPTHNRSASADGERCNEPAQVKSLGNAVKISGRTLMPAADRVAMMSPFQAGSISRRIMFCSRNKDTKNESRGMLRVLQPPHYTSIRALQPRTQDQQLSQNTVTKHLMPGLET